MSHRKAIPTKYAGHFFRSRLEAKWAVFFDSLGIRWEYEREGYEVEDRLFTGVGPGWYLPDFWLPEFGMHAEVKGFMDADSRDPANHPAHILSRLTGLMTIDGSDSALLLGPIPRRGRKILPTRLHFHKGDLLGYPWTGETADSSSPTYSCGRTWYEYVGDDGSGLVTDKPERLLDGMPLEMPNRPRVGYAGVFEARRCANAEEQTHLKAVLRAVDAGYTAASSARFEHGEVPDQQVVQALPKELEPKAVPERIGLS